MGRLGAEDPPARDRAPPQLLQEDPVTVLAVVPAQAGTHPSDARRAELWIPAFAFAGITAQPDLPRHRRVWMDQAGLAHFLPQRRRDRVPQQVEICAELGGVARA